MSFIQMYREKYMRFPEGRCKAATFSYDDGVRADKKLVEIFDKYGVKATFNLNSELFDAQCWHGRMDEEETFNTFSHTGHEIALHGARHVFLDKVTLPEAIDEILKNRAYLEEKFKRIVDGFAYPYNSYNGDITGVIKKLGVKYARTTQSTHTFDIPRDWLLWNPTCHHADKAFWELLEEFLKLCPRNMAKHRESLLFYVWGHSYEFDDDNNWDLIETACKKLSDNSDVWFATNGEIYNYIQAYNGLKFSLDGERCFNGSYMAVWLEIRGKTYKIGAGKEVVFDK